MSEYPQSDKDYTQLTKMRNPQKNQIRKFKAQAIFEGDETGANVLWRYETMFDVQNEYHNAYANMQREVGLSAELDEGGCDSPKSKAYEAAWNEIDCCDRKIFKDGFLYSRIGYSHDRYDLLKM